VAAWNGNHKQPIFRRQQGGIQIIKQQQRSTIKEFRDRESPAKLWLLIDIDVVRLKFSYYQSLMWTKCSEDWNAFEYQCFLQECCARLSFLYRSSFTISFSQRTLPHPQNMAIIPLADGAVSNGNGGIEMQTPTRRSWNPLTWFSPAPTQPTEVEDIPDDNTNAIDNHVTPQVPRMEVKDRIDEAFAMLREGEAEAALRDPKRKFDFQLDITPDDEKWQSWFETFQTQLQQGTVLEVLGKYFEEAHLLLIQPAPTDGVIFQLQKNNAAEYRRALAGRFNSQSDNLITKLTMLNFGLPVEPMTLNNILRAGHDENDPEDAPEEVPRVQRIMYAEKPLEFLDKYHGRNHASPMLRSKFTTTSFLMPC
jgi:hypothetical protein